MLLIEKTVKLLDDFHFSVFREHVKNLSLRSYYPMVLIDVIDRDFQKEQTSEKLFELVYGDQPVGEKDMKKFFQLAHYTFKLTSFLARNYPDYLPHNISRTQHFINSGKLDAATNLAEMVLDVSRKIEDIDSEMKVLQLLAQREGYLESHKEASNYYVRIGELLKVKQCMNEINYFVYEKFKDKGKDTGVNIAEMTEFLQQYQNNKSVAVQLISRLNIFYLLYLYRDPGFYKEETYKELKLIEDALEKNNYIVFPYLLNIRPKLSFLKLNYTIRQFGTESVLEEATSLIEQSEEDLFWNSFINQPEINSIAIQTSYLITNYFTSYRDDHLQLLDNDIKDRIKFLKTKCRHLMENKLLQEKFVIRYINVSTLYTGLLLLGTREDIKEGFDLMEGLLLSYQQVAFHAYIDPIYLNMTLAGFCLQDFEAIERTYRRYKKSTTGKIVNVDNDLGINGFYYAAKWLETKRDQYAKKMSAVIEQSTDKTNINTTRKILIEVATYFKIPVKVVTIDEM